MVPMLLLGQTRFAVTHDASGNMTVRQVVSQPNQVILSSELDASDDSSITLLDGCIIEYTVKGSMLGNCTYSVFDILGRKKKSGKIKHSRGIVDCSDLQEGNYVFAIESGNAAKSYKFYKN